MFVDINIAVEYNLQQKKLAIRHNFKRKIIYYI